MVKVRSLGVWVACNTIRPNIPTSFNTIKTPMSRISIAFDGVGVCTRV